MIADNDFDHSLDIERNNQMYRLELSEIKTLSEDTIIEIYQSENFFGSPVTFGVRTRVEEIYDSGREEAASISLTVKASVCSEEDTYSPELGQDIVIGRLLNEKDVNALYSTNFIEESVELGRASVLFHAGRLADYLLKKSEYDAFLEMHQSQVHSTLKKDFKDFK